MNYPQNPQPQFPGQQQFSNPNAPLPQMDSGFGNQMQREPRWDANIPWYDIQSDNQWHTMRFFGPVFTVNQHWFKTRTGKNFTMLCPDFDSSTGYMKPQPDLCPIETDFVITEQSHPNIKGLKGRPTTFVHAIIRSIQMQGNPHNDPNWTPVRPLRLPISVVMQLRTFKSANRVTVQGKTYEADISDPYYGKDVSILYNKSNPNMRYTVMPGNQTPLTQEEQLYINRMYDWKTLVKYPTTAELKQSLVQNGYYQLLNGGAPQGQQPQGPQHLGDVTLPQAPQPPQGGFGMVTNIPAQAPQQQYAPPQQQYAPPVAPQAPQYAPPVAPQAPQFAPQPQAPQYAPPVAPQAPQFAPQPQAPQAPQPGYPQPGQGGNPGNFSQAPVAPALPGNVVASAAPAMGFAPPPGMPVGMPNLVAPTHLAPPGMPQPMAPAPLAPPSPLMSTGVQAPQAPTGERKFQVAGSAEPVSIDRYQQILGEFTTANDAGQVMPMKVAEGDLAGIQVPKCYGSYKGNNICLRCPARRFCLQVA